MDSDIIELKVLFICIVIGLVITSIMNIMAPSVLPSVDKYKIYYTYVDLDNNEGIADKCKHDRTPICKLEDGTVIAVKQYKRIRESKGE